MFRKKRRPEGIEPQGVLALVEPGGLLLEGPAPSLELILDRLTSIPTPRLRRLAVDQAAIATSAAGFAHSSREYVRFSPESWRLLQEHGAIPGEGGFFRMFVHDGQHIAGQLQWAAERLAPEQMLSLQVAAVGLALRTVIFEVEQSLQRVEDKVDQIVRLLRAERLGEVLGDHRTLDGLARRVRNSGRISAADWGSVDDLAPKIARDLETLRAHIRASIAEAEPRLITWVRAGEAEELMEEGWLGESLALLSVAQHNLALWHELRIAHVAATEPSHLTETIEDARAQIESQRRSDQDLLGLLSERAAALVEPRRLDGLDPISVRRLRRARSDLESLIVDFAEQRLLDPAPLPGGDFPPFSKSAVHLATTVGRGARGLATGINRVVRRRDKPDLPQLPTGSEDQEPAP